jgi:hypothetical protein
VGQNAFVADVSIYVALITAGAGALGAAIPQIAAVARDVRLAGRDRQEHRADARREACVEFLRAVNDLRTQVANAALYRGDEIASLVAEIRSCSAAVELHALSVGLLARDALAEPVERVTAAARELAAAAVQNTDMNINRVAISPDFAAFDQSVEEFWSRALASADE